MAGSLNRGPSSDVIVCAEGENEGLRESYVRKREIVPAGEHWTKSMVMQYDESQVHKDRVCLEEEKENERERKGRWADCAEARVHLWELERLPSGYLDRHVLF